MRFSFIHRYANENHILSIISVYKQSVNLIVFEAEISSLSSNKGNNNIWFCYFLLIIYFTEVVLSKDCHHHSNIKIQDHLWSTYIYQWIAKWWYYFEEKNGQKKTFWFWRCWIVHVNVRDESRWIFSNTIIKLDEIWKFWEI